MAELRFVAGGAAIPPSVRARCHAWSGGSRRFDQLPRSAELPRRLPGSCRDWGGFVSVASQEADSAPAHEPVSTEPLGHRLVSDLEAAGAAFERIAMSSSSQIAAAAPGLVGTLLSNVIPRLEAEQKVLVPALERLGVPPDVITQYCRARPEVGLLAEELSRIADRPARRNDVPVASLRRLVRRLADLIRGHAALELDLAREFLEPNGVAQDLDGLISSLTSAQEGARNSILLVAPPAYLPTEAYALRHNPRPPRIMRLRDLEENEDAGND
jgi:hypothetical protein